METCVYLTIDTEYSSGLVKDLSSASREDNFARSIACMTASGPAGITHKLDLFEQHGIKAVFFVDPMPALVWGVAAIEDIVGPILDAGQDVQLHCHTEWLALAGDANPLPSKRTGVNLFDFPLEEQRIILEYARDTLVAAGAHKPVAFRAGNYGADDNTLRALRDLGIKYDSSHTPGLPDACRISLSQENRCPIEFEGMTEVPTGCIGTIGGGLRHAQITAISLNEMLAAIRHAQGLGCPSFTLVTHSFELFNRYKLTANPVVRRRFEGLCRALSNIEGVATANYRDAPPVVLPPGPSPDPLPASIVRTGYRYAEQVVSNSLYGAA